MPGAPSWVGCRNSIPPSLSQEVESQVNRTAVPLTWKGLFRRTLNATLYFGWPVISPKGADVAVKQIRVSDLSGKQADDDQMAKLVIHEHPQYQGPIILDVLPDELGEVPESERYVSIEVIQPGDRSGQKALISLDRFNKLTADMNTIVMDAVAAQASPTASEAKRRPRRSGASGQRGKVNYASLEHAGEPHRGRITQAEKDLVRDNLKQINKRLRQSGLREIDPAEPTMRDRYGL
jgi:hypothetical protein